MVVREGSPISLIYSVMAGPIIWFIHFMAVYAIAEFGCRVNFINLIFVTPMSIRIAVVVLTLVALVAVAVGGVMAYRNRPTAREKGDSPAERRQRFLADTGLLLSGLFIVSIILTAAPTFFVQVCDQAV